MKEEGVSVLRSRFGFTRRSGPSYNRQGEAICVSTPRTEQRQTLFLKKLEYFNSNPAQNTNKLNNRNTGSKLRTNSRDAVNNSVNISRATEQNNSNANQDKSDRSKSLTKIFTQVSPKIAPRKADLVQGSQLKKPLFVTKYSPYRGEARKPPASAPLITTAENGQLSRNNDPQNHRSNSSTKPSSSTSAMQKPSQLPGLRASFLNSDNNRLTSASLHRRSYGYQDTSQASRSENNKAKLRKFVSYKNKVPESSGPSASAEPRVDQTPKSRKWLAKKTEEKGLSELECLNRLRLSNKMMLEQQSVTKPGLPTIPQDTELCEDCVGETEEDSGIFTSSHSKYSLDDEMIESDEPPSESPRGEPGKDIKNFSSDSEETCSRETSPMQLLADLLRRTPDSSRGQVDLRRTPDSNGDQVDGKSSKHNESSLVKLRKQQFEDDFRKLEATETKRSFLNQGSNTKPHSSVDLRKISNIPDLISRTSLSPVKGIVKSGSKDSSLNPVEFLSSGMESSLVSNTSRLSVCTDCTGTSEDIENKFFDDDYNDQQQLILNSEQDQTTFDENLFDAVDCLLQENQEDLKTDNVDGEAESEEEMKTAEQALVPRVKQILEEESVWDRQVSVDTMSSLESDVCMLDLDDGFSTSDESPESSRPISPVIKTSPDLNILDVVSIKKLLLELQGVLSQSEGSSNTEMEDENSSLKRDLSLLRLKVAERDRRIETLERRLEYCQSHSLARLNNIATQTQSSSTPKPRPLSWDLTSISLVRNINNL